MWSVYIYVASLACVIASSLLDEVCRCVSCHNHVMHCDNVSRHLSCTDYSWKAM